MDASATKKLLQALEARFETNMRRHAGLRWALVSARLQTSARHVKSLQAMESSGGEPDVISHDKASGRFTFCDCAPESPPGRRSLCYDGAALDARKENKPGGSVVEMAASMGIELLDEGLYRELQNLGDFDTRTSSWIKTPGDIRSLGGALFCDRRYGKVFVYHNGAQSYYASRGFRGLLRV
jgi:hypothetical protein